MQSHFIKYRTIIIAISQASLLIIAYLISFLLRFDFRIQGLGYRSIILQTLPLLLIVKLPVFYYFRLFSGWWKYAGMNDLLDIIKAAFVSSSFLYLVVYFIYGVTGYPRSTFLLDMLMTIILIGGTAYAGELKKAVFSVLNYVLPPRGVMPMHCSANIGPDGDTAIFFGLSGTGKTTLSADASRTLIGDDEHGWSDTTVFNFEGGCYAKMIRLSAEAEPEIFATTQRFGTILENVVMDPVTKELDLDDACLAENSRGAYPIEFIPNASKDNLGPPPRNIIMLTADAFGVLPPVAKLSPEQAMYHFLSGYTAKVAGTEIGVTEPEATFSTCFGAPFMPRHPSVYGELLKQRISEGEVDCWLVNTGWTGGKFGVGSRMPIKVTRALVNAALSGGLKDAEFRIDPNFGFRVPVAASGVDAQILNPRDTWSNGTAYDEAAAALAKRFRANFTQFADRVTADVLAAEPPGGDDA